MKYTNINILNNNGYEYPYAVGIDTPGQTVEYSELKYTILETGQILLYNPKINIFRNENDFYSITSESLENANWAYIPWYSGNRAFTGHEQAHKICKLRIFWPGDGVDTYEYTNYVFNVTMYIGETEVILGRFLLHRIKDALAISDGVQRMNGVEYVECTDFNIIDPWSVVYDDGWKSFREDICGERPGSNNESTQINFSLIPVSKTDEDSVDHWIMRDGYVGGQNSINMSSDKTYFDLNISPNIGADDYNNNPGILCKAQFNEIYENDLLEYLRETYDLENAYVAYELIVSKDQKLAYTFRDGQMVELRFVSPALQLPEWLCDDVIFSNWTEYEDGMVAYATINVFDFEPDPTDDDDMAAALFSIKSNPLPITKELFKFLTTNNGNHQIYDITELDMETYNVTILNKNVTNVIKYDHTDDSKANIVQPMFFRNYELEFITLHPAVTENICINLDIYKSKVEQFQIQIEGISFMEIGRAKNGVIFQIQGNKLPKVATNGTYYILDQDGLLVTTGKYTYEL